MGDIIKQIADYVKKELSDEITGHDWKHTYRVWQTAKYIGQKEGADLTVVQLSALLHDIADWKLHKKGMSIGLNKTKDLLEKLGTDEELAAHKIDTRYVVPTISKTRYVQKYILTKEDFSHLKDEQRNIWLLNIQQDIVTLQDKNLEDYLEYGLKQDVHEGSLVKTRKVWYQTEKRDIPSFLYTYLSRGNPRFILNKAKVRPLNTFLMVYPKEKIKLSDDILTIFWVILNSQTTIRALRDVGRCYGGDTLKIEPKEMMKALIVNPFNLSSEAKQELLNLAEKLKTADTVQNRELIKRIDLILEKELKS